MWAPPPMPGPVPQLMGAVPKARLHGEDGQDREDGQAVTLVKGLYILKPQFPLCAERTPRLRSPLATGPTGARSTEVGGYLMRLKPLLGFGQNDFTVVTFKQD